MIEKKVALITGASRGLGRATALAFAKHGYAIGINYHENQSEAEQTAQLVKDLGVPAKILKADVGDSKEVEAMVRMVEAEWGRVDVLVNNAGLSRDKVILKMTDEDWNQVFQINAAGAFYCTRSVVPVMAKAEQGAIVNVVSYLAKRPAVGAANYSAAKAALLSFTQSSALEFGRYNVRVNAVLPGFHVTDLNQKVWQKYEDQIRKQHLLKELPNKEEFAEFVFSVAQYKTVTGQLFSFESRLVG